MSEYSIVVQDLAQNIHRINSERSSLERRIHELNFEVGRLWHSAVKNRILNEVEEAYFKILDDANEANN